MSDSRYDMLSGIACFWFFWGNRYRKLNRLFNACGLQSWEKELEGKPRAVSPRLGRAGSSAPFRAALAPLALTLVTRLEF